MPRQSGHSIPKGQRDHIRQKAWQMSKDGMSVVKIAERLDLNRITIQSLLNEQYEENRDLRKSTGVAEQDLLEYIAVMDDARFRASQIYGLTMHRLQEEEALEAQHAEIRHADGKPPTTAITRALQFQMNGVPTALKAVETMMSAMERKGKALGLEAAGRESAKRQLDTKVADLMDLFNQEVSIEVKVAPPPLPGWDSPEDDDD